MVWWWWWWGCLGCGDLGRCLTGVVGLAWPGWSGLAMGVFAT